MKEQILDQKLDTISIYVPKPHLTTPNEFHFAKDERLGQAAVSILDQLKKLALHSNSSFHSQKLNNIVPGLAIPNSFNLHTEERELQKEMLLQTRLAHKQEEEARARTTKATPIPMYY